ncbi:MAG: Gpi16 subunit, GPI transamidase component-domain-containing protein [Monoraphidium minutum]|nr:MAG: Gpi16 subunit, GPI transamidase component-domain-containing protein [Monoraphidium minutum]
MERIIGLVLLLALVATGSAADGPVQEEFSEEVVVSPLPSGHVQVHLHFTLSAPSRRHYTLLPKAVGQLAAGVPFDEVELSLTQGRWHHHTWGSPLLPSKPTGAELRAAFSPSIPDAALAPLWGNLSHALGGMFCASLNFLARPETTARQAIKFGPRDACGAPGGGGDPAGSAGACPAAGAAAAAGMAPRPARLQWLYAALPKEAVCTENLTPALKLLPCRDQAGVAALLLHRPTVYGADYHSMRVHIAAERGAGGALLSTRLSLSVALVLRPPAAAAGAPARPAPRPRTYSSWRLGPLMGSELRGVCPVAGLSRLLVQLPPQLAAAAAAGEEGAAALLRPPAWLEAGAAGAADGGSGGGGGSEGQRQADTAEAEPPPPAAAGGAAARRRAEEWDAGAFVLSPAPDGVVAGRRDAGGGGGGGGGAAAGPVFYAYDLRALDREARAAAAAAAAAPDAAGAPPAPGVDQAWRGLAEKGAAPAAGPGLAVARYTTGAGYMNGGAVLEITVSDGDSGGGDEVSPRTVCVFQTVPWYVRVWLHTLRLAVDGAPADLDAALALRHVSPAADRARPLVLDLCLDLPADARRAALSMEFSTAFLHVFEWPPDAHRGFDVPAAIVTYAPRGGGGGGGGVDWEWRGCSGGGAGGWAPGPLLAAVGAARPGVLYSEGLLVPLAPPDFSMPYNVVCLTSTVLAVYLGASLNALLRRPGQEARDRAAKGGGAAAARRKVAKVAIVSVVFGGLALYVDEELREQAAALLARAGLVAPAAEPVAGQVQQRRAARR